MTEVILVEFARRARQARLAKRLTQEQVAEASGLHLTYIAGLESGRRNPTLLSIVALAAGLGVEPNSLLEGIKAVPK